MGKQQFLFAKHILCGFNKLHPRLLSQRAAQKCLYQTPVTYQKVQRFRQFCTNSTPENSLMQILKKRIKMAGPMPLASYMKEVLTNPQSGYYMHKDVFGSSGDFITSPEISQMFGEMVAVWIVNEWMNNCDGKPLQLVELGPGRGTLADDILRVICQFPDIKDKVSLHLVEVSPTLSQIQAEKLTGLQGVFQKAGTRHGIDVTWHQSLTDVPEGMSCFIAHEFLDALPIHKFQKTESGWREVFVDLDPAKEDALRFVLSPAPTPATVALLKMQPSDKRDHIEINPGAGLVVQEICRRIKKSGGMALLADYGHTGEKEDTFRGFKQHQLHDPLLDPGCADLTADVDFSYLSSLVDKDLQVFGPVTQEYFLINMGIGVRLHKLLQTTKQENWGQLISGFKMLTQKEQMGERFKFMSILGETNKDYKPAGFVDLPIEPVENTENK